MFVEHIPSRAFILGEAGIQYLANGRALYLGWWTLHMPLEIRCKNDSRHFAKYILKLAEVKCDPSGWRAARDGWYVAFNGLLSRVLRRRF